MKAVTHLGGLGWHSNNRGKEREKRRGDSFSGSFEKGCLEESVPVQKTEALSVGFLLFSGNALKSAAWLESTADTVSSRQEKKKDAPLGRAPNGSGRVCNTYLLVHSLAELLL